MNLSNKRFRYVIFTIISLIVTYFFSKIPLIYDDAYNHHHSYLFKNVFSDFHIVYDMYFHWSSRTLVNFIMYQCEAHGNWLFLFLVFCNLMVLLNSLKTIFNNEDVKIVNLALCFVVLCFPFNYLSGAGWIATSTTYLFPICIAIYASTSIFIVDEGYYYKIRIVCLFLATLYASNNEQVMVVIALLFFVKIIELMKNNSLLKKQGKILIIQFFAIVINLLWFVFSPGNKARSVSETKSWFNNFNSLNIFNKIDIGYMQLGQHLLFGNLLWVLMITIIPMIYVMVTYKRTNMNFKEVINAIMALIVLIGCNIIFDLYTLKGRFGRLLVFPKRGLFYNGINLFAIIQFVIYTIFLILLFNNFKYFYSKKNIWLMLAMYVGGVLSKLMVGLSPTSFISGTRTFAVMGICIIVLIIPFIKKLLIQYSDKITIYILGLFAFSNLFIFYWQVSERSLKLLPLWLYIISNR